MRCVSSLLVASAICSSASAQMSIPNDFESAAARLTPQFSYFGGVQSFSTAILPSNLFSGSCLGLSVNFRHDNFFQIAGVGIGTGVIARPALAVPAAAQFFSITVEAPPTGTLTLKVAVREDDDNDGLIDVSEGDDQWETANIPLAHGIAVYNFPLSAFTDADPDAGNNTQNFTTTNRMAVILTIETRASLPGGIIETPVALRFDHMGFFAAAQVLPPRNCPVDFNADGMLTPDDLDDFITGYFSDARPPAIDFDANGIVTPDDLADFISAFFDGCA